MGLGQRGDRGFLGLCCYLGVWLGIDYIRPCIVVKTLLFIALRAGYSRSVDVRFSSKRPKRDSSDAAYGTRHH